MSDATRPPVWVGHVSLRSADVAATDAFMRDIGMRGIFRNDEVAVLELRGGTHLVVLHDADARGADAAFDLMVEDLDGAHATFRARGLTVTEVERGKIHDRFQVTEPGGNRITFNSSHVRDPGSV